MLTTPPTFTATTPTAATAATGMGTATVERTAIPTTAAPTGEEGQGDEQRTRVPASFKVSGGGSTITPRVVTVPAYFNVELRIAASGGDVRVSFAGTDQEVVNLTVKNGGSIGTDLGSLPPGRYVLRTNGGATATIRSVSGGDVGP